MANDDIIAALERQAERMLIGSPQDVQDHEAIRKHIDALRSGGERAKVVAWLEAQVGGGRGDYSYGWDSAHEQAAIAIASGAHEVQP